MEKLYERINFENSPSVKTPLSEENLNKIDGAIDGLDDRVIDLKSDLSKKFNSENIVQTTGDSETAVMSQKAVTNVFAEERNRAVARENEIEALFSLPTQEAVNKWLNEHPEATTTVQDKSLTIDKMVVGTLGYVTPEMFGAVGDGATDDKDAFARCAETGHIIYLQRGKAYSIGDLEIANDICIIGDFDSAIIGTLVVTGCAMFNGVRFEYGETGSNYTVKVHGRLTAQNCEFNGNGGSPMSLLTVSKGDGTFVNNCLFLNNPTARLGMSIVSSSNVTVENCHFDYIGGSGFEMFDVCNDVTIKNNLFTHCNIYQWASDGAIDGVISTYGDSTGTGTTSSRRLIISGNKICEDLDNPGIAIRINGVEDCLVEKNIIITKKTNGIFVQDRVHSGDGTYYVVRNRNVSIVDNIFEFSGDVVGIKVFECDGINIRGNKIHKKVSESDGNITQNESAIIIGREEHDSTFCPSVVCVTDNEITGKNTGEYNYGILANIFDDLLIKNNCITWGRGIFGNRGKIRVLGNVIHTVAHGYIIRCGADTTSFIHGNIYSWGEKTGSISVGGNSVYNDGNIPDNNMNI